MKAYTILRPRASTPVLLTCEHASPRIPRAYGTLGLGRAGLRQVSDWYDLGAAAVTRQLSAALGATALLANQSRLVIDLARLPDEEHLIRNDSRGTPIPGNARVSRAERRARLAQYYRPYHTRIAAELRRLLRHHDRVLLVDVHSFNAVLNGVRRRTEIGVLYRDDADLPVCRAAKAVLERSFRVAYNQPYSGKRTAARVLQRHAGPRPDGGLVQGIEFEINDALLKRARDRRRVSRLLVKGIKAALLSPSSASRATSYNSSQSGRGRRSGSGSPCPSGKSPPSPSSRAARAKGS